MKGLTRMSNDLIIKHSIKKLLHCYVIHSLFKNNFVQLDILCLDCSAFGAASRMYQRLVGLHWQASSRPSGDHRQSQTSGYGCHHSSHDHWQSHLQLRTQEEEGIPQVSTSGWNWKYWGKSQWGGKSFYFRRCFLILLALHLFSQLKKSADLNIVNIIPD